MEEKRTPLTIAEGILDNIISVADKFTMQTKRRISLM